jgi:serine/threonine protein kinase
MKVLTEAGRQLRMGEPIGGGAEGLVMRGEYEGKSVAVKILRPDRTGTRQSRTRALVARALSVNVDSRIAGPFDMFEFDSRVGHVSPLAPGIDVNTLTEQPDVLNPRQRMMATLRLGALLARIHKNGIAFGDLNKGAVKVRPAGEGDAEVYLVDLDSSVMRGVSLPPTLGAPDTAAIELRLGKPPATVEGWQASDWTAFGHVAIELLLNKTAACGIDDPETQVEAFMGVPPFLKDTSGAAKVDRAAGLPRATLGPEICRLLGRLFDPRPALRDGAALVRALATEVVNNHQVLCGACRGAFLVHAAAPVCPICGAALCPPLQLVLTDSRRIPLTGDVAVTRDLLGGAAHVSRLHARLFRLGAVTFICSLTATSQTRLIRDACPMRLSRGIHVPLMPGDRLSFGSGSFVETLVAPI